MPGLIVACVRTGPIEEVIKLRNAVARHMARPYTMICLTDQPAQCEGVTFVDVTEVGLTGRWIKMLLFEPLWRERKKVICLDLGVTIVSDVTPLADVPGEFAICGAAGKYNSSAMVIGGGMASFVWERFDRNANALMARHRSVEDCIEALYPGATFLQWVLPKGFFGTDRAAVAGPAPAICISA